MTNYLNSGYDQTISRSIMSINPPISNTTTSAINSDTISTSGTQVLNLETMMPQVGILYTPETKRWNPIETQLKIPDNTIAIDKLKTGVLTSNTITLQVRYGQGDAFIAAGKSDFTNIDAGFILGIDESDSHQEKFYIGDSSQYLNWTGSSLVLSGSIMSGMDTFDDVITYNDENTEYNSDVLTYGGSTGEGGFFLGEVDGVWKFLVGDPGAGRLSWDGTDLIIYSEETTNPTLDASILKNLTISTIKLANSAVTTAKLANSAVTTDKIADMAITTAKIDDWAITNELLAYQSVDTDQLANDSIITRHISNSAITPEKLLFGTGESWVWKTWTPSLTNLSGGHFSNAEYIQIGKNIFFRLIYILGGAGVSGAVSFTLPSFAKIQTGYVANAEFYHSGTYFGRCEFSGNTSSLYSLKVFGNYIIGEDLSATTPFIWGNNDVIYVSGFYESY